MIMFFAIIALCSFCLICGIVTLITGYEIFGIILLFIFLISFILIYVLLAINTKKIVIKNKKYNKANIRINVSEIIFFEENGLWKTNIDDNIVLDLSECFFKKKYIEAYVTRLIRYNEKQIMLKNFFRRRYFLKKYKERDLILNINGKKIYIIKNGYSIQSLLSQLISQSYFMEKYVFFRTAIPFLNGELNNVSEIDFVNKFKGKIKY